MHSPCDLAYVLLMSKILTMILSIDLKRRDRKTCLHCVVSNDTSSKYTSIHIREYQTRERSGTKPNNNKRRKHWIYDCDPSLRAHVEETR